MGYPIARHLNPYHGTLDDANDDTFSGKTRGDQWQKWHLDLRMLIQIGDGYGTHGSCTVLCGGFSWNNAGNLELLFSTRSSAHSREMATPWVTALTGGVLLGDPPFLAFRGRPEVEIERAI